MPVREWRELVREPLALWNWWMRWPAVGKGIGLLAGLSPIYPRPPPKSFGLKAELKLPEPEPGLN